MSEGEAGERPSEQRSFKVFDAESPSAIVEVKAGLSALRGVRDASIVLAEELMKKEDRRAYLLLVNPRIARSNLREEWCRIQSIFRQEIAQRLHLIVYEDGRFGDIPPAIPADDRRLLDRCVSAAMIEGTSLPEPDMRSEVKKVVLLQWIRGGGAMTAKWLSQTVGCDYRTVVAAIEELGDSVRRHSDRSVELKYFPERPWVKMVAVQDRARSTMRYIDRSGQPRSPESLARRLARLDRTDIAIGGVLGARHHDANLDLLGTPRLDLCIHSPDKQVDLGFTEILDPGLVPTDDRTAVPRLVLQFLRRRESFFEMDREGQAWADPVECLLDLHEAGLQQPVAEFARFLAQQAEGLSG